MQEQEAPTWLLGILIGAIVTLGGVIAYLFRVYHKQNAHRAHEARSMERERNEWNLERASWKESDEKRELALRAEYELKHREVVQAYEKKLVDAVLRYEEVARSDRANSALRESHIRSETGAMIERISNEASEANKAMVALLQKMQDRLLGGPSRRRGG